MKPEADSNDITEYIHHDKPSTGMFRFCLCNTLYLTVTCE